METSEENMLEVILRKAADEPAHRPEFYQTLLDSNVYILGSAGEGEGATELQAGSKISIYNWEKQDGTPIIPFFSSFEVLRKSIDSEQPYLQLPAKSLFELTVGATLFLNPKSPYGKEFLPQEVGHMLSVGIGREPIQRVVEKETKVLLGQPSSYPSKMVDSLTQLFVKHKNVKKAYLCLMHDQSLDVKPHLVIGIQAEGDIEIIMRAAGNVAADTAPNGESVDLCHVLENEAGLSNYFITQTKPFYEQTWGSKILSFFKSGKA